MICNEADDVRLVNGSSSCSGRVQVFRWGQWGTVYQRNWDMKDAAVVCRQLGCGSAVSVPSGDHFGEGSGRMVLGDVSCNGTESALRDCGSLDGREHNLPHTLDAGVICSDFVRLVGGSDLCSGRVEVKSNQSWSPVCDAHFDWQDARVVCRELTCGRPSALHRGGHFVQGEGPFWSKRLQCEGHESFLHECLTSNGPEQNCTHENVVLICSGPDDVRLVNGTSSCSGTVEVFRWGQFDAGVICSDFVRLVGGSDRCSGRVEVTSSQSWSPVCDVHFDWQDAQVVCRELDCGHPSALHRGGHFGQGEGLFWSKRLQCEGHESFLHECLTSDGPEQNCTHGSEVELICTGTDDVSGRQTTRLWPTAVRWWT
ncbi:deleted in malignant brain tumors 1 protein-like [Arapaima gigas]